VAVLVPYLATFFGCAFGSVVPLLNTEILVFGIAAATPSHLGWPLVLLAASGTMIGKLLLYFAGRGAVKLRIRGRQRVDRFLEEIERRQGLTDSLLFVSAASGLPPFYVVTVASGAAGLALSRFLAVGFAGRFLRFAAVVFAPHLIKDLIR
jgi:membrane protein YqaA with SNARE-associated domain